MKVYLLYRGESLKGIYDCAHCAEEEKQRLKKLYGWSDFHTYVILENKVHFHTKKHIE